MTQQIATPNPEQSMPEAANGNNAVPSLESIAEKMTAMRNQVQATRQTATGSSEEANAERPVAPTTPEDSLTEAQYDQGTEEGQALEAAVPEDQSAEDADDQVSTQDADTTAQEIIDFVDFAEQNPNAKFKFVRNGKEMVIDAKKAAAILGQGGAIHEEARQLKIEKAEFDEYIKETKSKQEGLLLAMEFMVAPKLKSAYDEIIKTQGYQNTFRQQLAQTRDPGERARIQANIQQNERYIQEQSRMISQLKPQIDTFYEARREQVKGMLEQSRKSFTDKELKNEYVFNEIREKVGKEWAQASQEIVPGIKNIDLISSDEFLMSLIRDGMKFRDRPGVKQAGASIAQLSQRKGSTPNTRSADDDINKLREKAKGRGKEATQAADNLLVAQLNRLRAGRRG